MRELLGRFHKERWNWALEGKYEYESGFLRLKKPEGDKRRVLIGVYGPTQVGKTTLILKLLGIKEDRIIELSRALRGKSQLGNSATVTTSIYQRSKDESFVLIYPDKSTFTFNTLEELEETMSKVRLRVETKEYAHLKPLIIQISSSYFDMEELSSRKREIEILDLPGDDSKNKKEMDHVVRCLKEYLTQCRACILVEIADYMVSLTQINREYVRDWQEKPQSFKVVLTRAATSSSTMTDIRDKKISTKDTFKSTILNQLNEHLNESGKSVKVYPLEYGDSWESLKATDPLVYNRAKPWIDQIFKELYEDLCSVMSPESEILQSRLEVEFVEKAGKEELARLERDKLELIKKKDSKKRDINRKSIIIEKHQEEIGIIEQDKMFVSDDIRLVDFEDVGMAEWKKGSGSWIKSSSDIASNILAAADSNNEYYKQQVESLNKSLKAIANKHSLNYKAMGFEPEDLAMLVIGSVKIKKHYISKKNFNEALGKCVEALERYTSELAQRIGENLYKIKRDLINKLEMKSKSLEHIIDNCISEILLLEDEIKEIENDIVTLKQSIEYASDEWEKDKERTKQFYLYLKKSFIKYTKAFQEKLQSPHTTSEEKWVYHQFWNMMRMDSERIIRNE